MNLDLAMARQLFDHCPTAAGAARRFTRSVLDGVDITVLDDVVLCVSELATNAVVHGCADSPFTLKIWVDGRRVRVECHDRGRGRPHLRRPGENDASGRGLLLVNELADRWGVVRRRLRTRKLVWFEMDTPTTTNCEARQAC